MYSIKIVVLFLILDYHESFPMVNVAFSLHTIISMRDTMSCVPYCSMLIDDTDYCVSIW